MLYRLLSVGLGAALALCVGGCSTSRLGPRPFVAASGSASDDGAPLPVAAPTSEPAPAASPEAPPAPRESLPPAPAPAPPMALGDVAGCSWPCTPPCNPWHVRGIVGMAFWTGTEAADDCAYVGVDVGWAIAGGWSVDAFWRGHTAGFERNTGGNDGGTWNHVGLKAGYQWALGGGRLHAWVGAGPEYWWNDDYLVDDDGLGLFAEVGLGYRLTRNVSLRAGLGIHGLTTETGRNSATDDDQGRALWVVAPSLGLEIAW